MPQYTPPPAQHQQQQQDQRQNQFGNYSTNASDLQQDVNSRNTNVVSTEGSLSAVQVNNFNSGELYIEGVGRKPIPHLNVTAFDFDGRTGFSVTFSTPIGGTSDFDTLAKQRIANEQLAYAVELSAACSAMKRNGISITNATNPALVWYREACNGVETTNKVKDLAEENAKLRILLRELQPQTPPPTPVPALW